MIPCCLEMTRFVATGARSDSIGVGRYLGKLAVDLGSQVNEGEVAPVWELTFETGKMKSVAVIGASRDRAKFGNKAVRAFLQVGYEVYPVHPREREIEGLKVYASVAGLPVRPQMVSVYLPPSAVEGMLPVIAERGCDELWLNPGSESPEVVAKAQSLGLNVIQACSVSAVGLSPESFE